MYISFNVLLGSDSLLFVILMQSQFCCLIPKSVYVSTLPKLCLLDMTCSWWDPTVPRVYPVHQKNKNQPSCVSVVYILVKDCTLVFVFKCHVRAFTHSNLFKTLKSSLSILLCKGKTTIKLKPLYLLSYK